MPKDLMLYLSNHHGRNLEKLLPDLKLVADQYRFDMKKFDLLGCTYSDEAFFGIKELRNELTENGLATLIEDAGWLKKFKGKPILLIPASKKEYDAVFNSEGIAGMFLTRYYSVDENEFIFTERPPLMSEKILSAGKDWSGIVGKMLTHPQVINYALSKAGKKSEVFKIAKLAYSVYRKVGG